MASLQPDNRYHEGLVRLIREMTRVARRFKAFDEASRSDPRAARPPVVEPFPRTGLREVDAVANMFIATYGVLSQHVGRLSEFLAAEDEPATKERATVVAVGLTDRNVGVFAEEAAAVVETLRRYAALLTTVAERHGARSIAHDGASFVAVFAPRADAEAPEALRGCRAGLEVLAALDQFNTYRTRLRKPPLRCSVGIHTGDVIFGALPSPTGRARLVVGPGVTGARLAQREAMDQIRPLLVSSVTAGEIGAAVPTEPLKDRSIRVGREAIALCSVALPPPHADYRALLDGMFGVAPPPPEDEET